LTIFALNASAQTIPWIDAREYKLPPAHFGDFKRADLEGFQRNAIKFEDMDEHGAWIGGTTFLVLLPQRNRNAIVLLGNADFNDQVTFSVGLVKNTLASGLKFVRQKNFWSEVVVCIPSELRRNGPELLRVKFSGTKTVPGVPRDVSAMLRDVAFVDKPQC
jgi:hypothetical protein